MLPLAVLIAVALVLMFALAVDIWVCKVEMLPPCVVVVDCSVEMLAPWVETVVESEAYCVLSVVIAVAWVTIVARALPTE